jgi:murein DD-endopeptidase MepM/ murein hydrolase activator NlpD
MDKRLLGALILLIGACMTADFVVSFQKAISFRKLLDYQTAVRKELLELSERFSEAKATFVDCASERQREYFAKQEERISALALELDAAKFKAERFSKSILRSFPHATSEKFGDALDEVKKRVLEKKEA